MQRPVWPLTQRLIHWGLVITIFVAWFTAGEYDDIHDFSGYVLFGLIACRVLLALFSSHPNGNGLQTLSKLKQLPQYTRAMLTGREQATKGLSPSGVVSVLVLLGLAFVVSYTGLMLTFEDYVGEPWLEELHADLFYLLVGWIVLHVAFIVFISHKQKHDKIKDMLTGGKL